MLAYNNGAGEHASEDAAAQGDPRVSVATPQGAQNDSRDLLLTSLDFSLGEIMSAGILIVISYTSETLKNNRKIASHDRY